MADCCGWYGLANHLGVPNHRFVGVQLPHEQNPRLRIDGEINRARFNGAVQPAGEGKCYLILSKNSCDCPSISDVLTAAEMRSWIVRIAKWDGVLPAIVWSAPVVVRWLIPNQRGPVEITAVVLPIIAFFIRFNAGRQVISTNNYRIAVRRFQMVALCIGILVLILVDAVMILIHIMPRGAAFATTNDVVVWIVLYSTYIVAMSIAMYPGTGHQFDGLSADGDVFDESAQP